MSKRPPSEPAGEGANGSKLPRLEGGATANGVSQVTRVVAGHHGRLAQP